MDKSYKFRIKAYKLDKKIILSIRDELLDHIRTFLSIIMTWLSTYQDHHIALNVSFLGTDILHVVKISQQEGR